MHTRQAPNSPLPKSITCTVHNWVSDASFGPFASLAGWCRLAPGRTAHDSYITKHSVPHRLCHRRRGDLQDTQNNEFRPTKGPQSLPLRWLAQTLRSRPAEASPSTSGHPLGRLRSASGVSLSLNKLQHAPYLTLVPPNRDFLALSLRRPSYSYRSTFIGSTREAVVRARTPAARKKPAAMESSIFLFV